MIISLTLISMVSGVQVVDAAVTSAHPWMTHQADQQRTGFIQSPAPNSNQTYWKLETGGPITSSPVVAAGIVFLNSADGYLYAVNATSGSKVWASWVGTSASSPTLTQNRVFVASSETVFAFDMTTGVCVWNHTLGEETSKGAPLAVGSRLFVGGSSTVFAFNEAYGVELYYEDIPHINEIQRLLYTDGLVVAIAVRNQSGFGLNGFEAVNTIGRFWMSLEPTGKDRYSSFLFDESAKFFAVVVGAEGNSSAFGVTQMGMMMWEHQIEGVTQAFPAYAYNTTYIPTNKYVYALNATDGSVQWSHPTTGAHSASSPAVADGKLYFGLDDNYVYALDASNGTLIWSYKTDGPVQSSPAISDGLLFVGSNDGNLYAIGYPKIQTFNAGTWDDTVYEVTVESDVAVSDLGFNVVLKQINFKIAGSSEAGSCKVTFPTNLLKGSYSVIADENQLLNFEEQTNATDTVLSLNFPRGISSVRIEGTNAIPEFSWWMPELVALGMLTGVLIMQKKRALQRNSELWRESQ